MKPEESEFRSHCLHAGRVRSDKCLKNVCASTLLTVLLFLLPAAVQAQFAFTTNNGTITITGYTGTNQLVIIPCTTNGLPVTSIVPNPNSPSILGFNFSVTNITVPDSVTNIGFGAFEPYAYPEAPSPDTFLNAITVDTNNPVYCSMDGVLIDKIHGTLIQYPCGKAASNYMLHYSVTNIADNAFYYCTNLASITIPDSVTNIGVQAFYWCFKLTNALIGNGVTSIGNQAFYFCTNLTSIILGNSLTNIGDYAFTYCYGLINLMIPNSVTGIGTGSFLGCRNLIGLYFQGNPPVLSHAGGNLFYGELNVTVYYLPEATGWGSTFGSVPAARVALWLPQIQNNNVTFGVQTNQFGFNINWAGGQTVVVEACTNLANPTWFPIQTNTLATGSSYFSDPQWTNYPGRYYRLRSP